MQAVPDAAPETTGKDPETFAEVEPAATLTDKLASWAEGTVAILPNLVVAIVMVALAWLIGRLVGRLVRRTAEERGRHSLGEVLGSFAFGVFFIVGTALALTVLAPTLTLGKLVGSLGIGSVAIGFAFKDILQNWLSGLLILLRQPFEVGDQIVSGQWEGTVEEIRTRATRIKTYDGQMVVIPNSEIYTRPVLVKTHYDIRRSQYDVGVGYSTDLKRACEIALAQLGETDGVLSDPAPEALPWELAGSGVVIRLRWWTKSDRGSVVHASSQVIDRIKRAYSDNNIDIPYETQVVLFHDQTDERDGRPGEQFEGWPAPADGRKVRARRELGERAPGNTKLGKEARTPASADRQSPEDEASEDRTTF